MAGFVRKPDLSKRNCTKSTETKETSKTRKDSKEPEDAIEFRPQVSKEPVKPEQRKDQREWKALPASALNTVRSLRFVMHDLCSTQHVRVKRAFKESGSIN